MTELDLLRAVREHDPDLPVILITGVPTLKSATEAIEHGIFRYLEKPFDQQRLKATVAQASRRCRLARTKREALELPGNPAGASDRVGLEVTFRRALESVGIAFRPIASGRNVYGYEALVRSADPAMQPLTHLLDAAERLGTLDDRGRIVRRRATESFHAAPREARLFLNLHPRDLLDKELATGVPKRLRRDLTSVMSSWFLEHDSREVCVHCARHVQGNYAQSAQSETFSVLRMTV